MKEIGKVIQTTDNGVVVEFQRSAMCDKCGKCGINKAKNMVITVEGAYNVVAGDYVEVETEGQEIAKASLIVYIIPLVLLVFGVLIGKPMGKMLGQNDGVVGAIIALIFLGVYFFILYFLEPRIKKRQKFVPQIIKVFSKEECIDLDL